MRYHIQSNKFLKRARWFIGNEFGINIQYWWIDCPSEVTFDTAYLEKGSEDEWEELVDSVLYDPGSEDNEDELEVEFDYPCPWFFTDPTKAASWELPVIEESISSNFRIIMNSSYIEKKAIEMKKSELPNGWSTMDDEFKWKIQHISPGSKQDLIEYQMMAKVWSSNAWTSEERLNEYLLKEFGMTIEDDIVTFYSPSVGMY